MNEFDLLKVLEERKENLSNIIYWKEILDSEPCKLKKKFEDTLQNNKELYGKIVYQAQLIALEKTSARMKKNSKHRVDATDVMAKVVKEVQEIVLDFMREEIVVQPHMMAMIQERSVNKNHNQPATTDTEQEALAAADQQKIDTGSAFARPIVHLYPLGIGLILRKFH